MRHGKAVGWVALVCSTLGTRGANAESVERGAVSLDGALVVTEKTTLTPSGVDSVSIEQSSTSWGVLNGGFGFRAAYGVSDNVVIAAQVLLSTQEGKDDANVPSDVEHTALSLTPRLEYVFANGSSARPFIAGMLGIGSATTSVGEVELTRRIYRFGGGFGLHAFVNAHFSIDPLLSFQFQSGSQEATLGSATGQTMDLSGTLIALTVSISGWFGGPARAAQRGAAPVMAVSQASTRASSPDSEENDTADSTGLAPVKTTQLLPGDHAIMLKGRPEALPSSVMVRFAENPNSTSLQGCKDVRLVIGDRFYRVERLTFRGRKAIAAQARLVSDGMLPVHAIDAAVVAEDSRFELCGGAWLLTPATRDAFRFFLGEFRQRGGTPPAPRPEPMPTPAPPPSETVPSDAPPSPDVGVPAVPPEPLPPGTTTAPQAPNHATSPATRATPAAPAAPVRPAPARSR